MVIAEIKNGVIQIWFFFSFSRFHYIQTFQLDQCMKFHLYALKYYTHFTIKLKRLFCFLFLSLPSAPGWEFILFHATFYLVHLFYSSKMSRSNMQNNATIHEYKIDRHRERERQNRIYATLNRMRLFIMNYYFFNILILTDSWQIRK